jgi:FkbM family methyltransferase
MRTRLITLKLALQNRNGEREVLMRTLLFRLARRYTPLIGVNAREMRCIVSTRESAGVGLFTFVHRGFEEDVMSRTFGELGKRRGLASLRGVTVLEVGANIGTETVAMLVRHGAARVVAVEPDVENARLLRANLALNGVEDRAEVHELALSDVDETLLLERSAANWGDHRIRVTNPEGPALADEESRTTVAVQARRLDTLVEDGTIDLDAVQLVWMDVQGHEGHMLAGAERLAAAGIPVVTEYWPYGLARSGGLDRFHSLVAQRYKSVVDIKGAADEPPEILPAARVAELAPRYPPTHPVVGFAAHTNLLLLP